MSRFGLLVLATVALAVVFAFTGNLIVGAAAAAGSLTCMFWLGYTWGKERGQ